MKPKIEYLTYTDPPDRALYDAEIEILHKADQTVQPALIAFEELIWFKGLGREIRDSTSRGFAAKRGRYEGRTYCIAGRVMITIERDDGHWFSLITAEESISADVTWRPNEQYTGIGIKNPRMGLGSHSMPPDEIAQTLIDMIAKPLDYKPSSSIHLG